VGPALETVADTQEQSRRILLTCTLECVETVRVTLNVKHWLNYSRRTVMSLVMAMETWG